MILWFKKLNPTMQIVAVIVLLLIVWQLYRIAKTYLQRTGQFVENAGEVAALNAQGVKKSYTDSQYSSFADQLYYAMKGWGTDEETIFNVFQKQNNDLDIIALINKFGIRDSYDLTGWLRGDLSGSDMNKLNNMLSNKGITKTF